MLLQIINISLSVILVNANKDTKSAADGTNEFFIDWKRIQQFINENLQQLVSFREFLTRHLGRRDSLNDCLHFGPPNRKE